MTETSALLKTASNEEQLKEVNHQIEDLTHRLNRQQISIDQLKDETFETGSPAFFDTLQKWAHQHSLSQYLDFLFDVAAGTDPQRILDKYLKQGADFPVNLTEPALLPIEDDLKAGKKPNFSIARAQILQIVDGQIIPQYKGERVAAIRKQMAQDQKQLAILRERLAVLGGC